MQFRREKQISYGKNTIAYDNYIRLIPKAERSDRDPRTPQKHRKYSRRQWEGMVKKWKQNIHSIVNALEDQEQTGDDGASIESWIDDVEEEENRRSRACSMTSSSSDQVISHQSVQNIQHEACLLRVLETPSAVAPVTLPTVEMSSRKTRPEWLKNSFYHRVNCYL